MLNNKIKKRIIIITFQSSWPGSLCVGWKLKIKMLRISANRVLGTTSLGVRVPARLYHERVVDHYDNPRNVGSFDKNDPSVGTGLVGAPACGDVMKLQIKVDDKTGKIVDARFKTFGCGSAIASSSVGNHKHKYCSVF